MNGKASKPRSVEQIIRILLQADGGQTVAEICREHNIAVSPLATTTGRRPLPAPRLPATSTPTR